MFRVAAALYVESFQIMANRTRSVAVGHFGFESKAGSSDAVRSQMIMRVVGRAYALLLSTSMKETGLLMTQRLLTNQKRVVHELRG